MFGTFQEENIFITFDFLDIADIVLNAHGVIYALQEINNMKKILYFCFTSTWSGFNTSSIWRRLFLKNLHRRNRTIKVK